MTANPLLDRQPQRAGRVTLESLEQYAGELNAMSFVRASDQPYFVNKRAKETGVEHYLDRKFSTAGAG